MSPSYPGRVHALYAGQPKTMCGLTATTVNSVAPNGAQGRTVTCQPCRSAIQKQAIK